MAETDRVCTFDKYALYVLKEPAVPSWSCPSTCILCQIFRSHGAPTTYGRLYTDSLGARTQLIRRSIGQLADPRKTDRVLRMVQLYANVWRELTDPSWSCSSTCILCQIFRSHGAPTTYGRLYTDSLGARTQLIRRSIGQLADPRRTVRGLRM